MLIQKAIISCCIFLSLIGLTPYNTTAQEAGTIEWLSFEQLDDAMMAQPKKVFVYFYASWCAYCHEMDRKTFQDAEVAKLLNNDFYAVKMNVETTDSIYFGKQLFVNARVNKRNPVHQIALLMASRKGKPFSLPAMVLLGENFKAEERYFQYLSGAQLIAILKEN